MTSTGGCDLLIDLLRHEGVTARRLFQEFPTLKRRLWKGHLWSPSYFVVTVGGAPLDELQKYVGSQRARRLVNGSPVSRSRSRPLGCRSLRQRSG